MNILLEYFHKGCISIVKHVLAQWCKEMKERGSKGEGRRGERANSEMINYQIPLHVNVLLLKLSDL